LVRTPRPSGLPPRLYLPILIVIAVLLFGAIGYFVAVGYGVTGSVFGSGKPHAPMAGQAGGTSVEGGPPPAVVSQLRTLRARIAAHPNDDVALTQLGDMYLAANLFSQAIPLYRRALHANPGNVAAKAGLEQAQTGEKDAASQ
jgi:cytochrome c-type biogenesis protein CcmH/NrfG